jgi:GNAT superfamily N-acetyltransferase
MIGDARGLDVVVPLPEGVRLRRVTDRRDVHAACAMQDEVFESQVADDMAEAILRRVAGGDQLQLWVAEAGDPALEGRRVVGAGRLDPVPGTDFAGIWGGATVPAWRGRGIYRALTAARARAALALGKTLIHSDSTEYSRPTLERSGLVKVSTTTPYQWHRD